MDLLFSGASGYVGLGAAVAGRVAARFDEG